MAGFVCCSPLLDGPVPEHGAVVSRGRDERRGRDAGPVAIADAARPVAPSAAILAAARGARAEEGVFTPAPEREPALAFGPMSARRPSASRCRR
jgi:hypothetical protein